MSDGSLYTYQDLAARFSVHVKTVYRWFRNRRKFRPTKNTVRISEWTVQEFEAEMTKGGRPVRLKTRQKVSVSGDDTRKSCPLKTP